MDRIKLESGDALLLVDMQNDFMPGGALAINGADTLIPVLNGYISRFVECDLPIIATRDWHPINHSSFLDEGGPWPPHCIADTPSAALVNGLDLPATTTIINKGTDVAGAGYSGFEPAAMIAALRRMHCRRLFLGGVATDYCVLQTALDACARGYQLFLLCDGVKAVDAKDGGRVLQRLQALGARLITLDDIEDSGTRR